MIIPLKILFTILVFNISYNTLLAQSEIPYKELSHILKIADGKKAIGKETFVPIYLKSKDIKLDFTTVRFNLISKAPLNTIKLNFELLEDIPIDSLTFYDLEYIEENYTMKLWVPLSEAKYKNYMLSHNQEKGSLSIVIGKVLMSNIDLEEKRAEYKKKLLKSKANKMLR